MPTAAPPSSRPADASDSQDEPRIASVPQDAPAFTRGGRRARERLNDGSTGRLLAECVRKAAIIRVFSRVGAFDGARLSMHAADHNETVLVFDIRRAELRKIANALLAAALLGADDDE